LILFNSLFKVKTNKLVIIVLLTLVFAATGFTGQVKAVGVSPVGTSIVADIAESSISKVVWITTTYETSHNNRGIFDLFNMSPVETTPSQGLGSGFFFDEKGYILTNAHVVKGAKTIEVLLKDEKTPIGATLVGLDNQMDVAIIKIDPPNKKVPFLKMGDSDQARIGDWVVAIGNPLGLDHTVTAGIISAKGRPLMVSGGNRSSSYYENMIQTDAAINPGNSGGPLLNLAGEVIGINTAVSSSGQGLGFAMPINSVREILSELMSKGKVSHPWIGVTLRDITTLDSNTREYLGITKPDGVIIVPVKNSPATAAGLRPYDIILEINHTVVNSSDEFVKIIRTLKVGEKVKLLISRQGNLLTKEVALEERPEEK
jgi:serine protease Do